MCAQTLVSQMFIQNYRCQVSDKASKLTNEGQAKMKVSKMSCIKNKELFTFLLSTYACVIYI